MSAAAMSKVLVVSILAAALAAVVPNVDAFAQSSQRIAAVVNDEIISLHDLDERLALVLATSDIPDRGEAKRRLAPQVLRALIDDRLKLQEARRLDITVTRSDIEDGLNRIESQLGIKRGTLPRFLSDRGVNPQALMDQVESELAWVRAVRRRLRGRLEIGDDEIDEAMARIQENVGKPEYRVAEIFLPVDRPDRDAETRQVADRLLGQIQSGASFNVLARNFSQGAAAAVGGDLGWIREGQLGAEIDGALGRLQPGQVSEPLRSAAGYHLLLILDRRVNQGLDDRQITATLSQLYLPLTPNPSREEIASQQQLARTMSDAAASCDDLEALGREAGSPLSGSLGSVDVNALPPHLRRVIRPLKAGEISPPVRSGNGIALLMVCERDERDTSEEGRKRVERQLRAERLAAESRRYLRDLRRTAFVDVRR